MAEAEPKPGWEAGHVAEPVDYPAILFQQLAVTSMAVLGTKDFHRHLQILSGLLSPFHDRRYNSDLEAAAKERDIIWRGKLKGISPKEAIEAHQRLWLESLMRLMKRHKLLGEEWVRG